MPHFYSVKINRIRMMKLTFKIIVLSLLVSLIFKVDSRDRFGTNESNFLNKELVLCIEEGNAEDVIATYEDAWNMEEFRFPRKAAKHVYVYKNLPLISRFSRSKLTENQQFRFIELLNDPSTFDWSETTWSIREADFIVRFFDENDEVIGKVWVCLDDCFMLESKPFAPTTKFGHFNTDEISQLLNAN
jgi:hypothetical protein